MRELESVLPQAGSVPTLFVWGSEDRAVDASSAGPLARHFPGSRTIVFPGVGHLPYEECPAEFNRVVIEFLKGKESPA
jgi:pimeloyl-ACP methyl ester carboxylesterase